MREITVHNRKIKQKIAKKMAVLVKCLWRDPRLELNIH